MSGQPTFYLDTNTMPPIESRYIHAPVEKAIARAFDLLRKVDEGQIGIYTSAMGDIFKGYAIRRPNSEPYFEPNLYEATS